MTLLERGQRKQRGEATARWRSWQLFDVAPMDVAIVTISVLGYASVMLLRLAAHLMTPWRRKS